MSTESPAGKKDHDITDDGLYIINLKNDTVVGSMQHTGSGNNNRITQDQLKQKVDSLQQLIAGKNVSEANKNYFIHPGSVVKISGNVDARVFGPYTTIPQSFDAASAPEVYKFYTTGEVRDLINKLIPMTKYTPGAN